MKTMTLKVQEISIAYVCSSLLHRSPQPKYTLIRYPTITLINGIKKDVC